MIYFDNFNKLNFIVKMNKNKINQNILSKLKTLYKIKGNIIQ